MNHTKPPTHPRGTITAVIIYDDIADAKRAIEVLRRASALCGASSHWEFKPWRADMLRRPTAADEALMEAVDADVIAIADIAGEKFRPWLMNWLQDWSGCRTSMESALVVTRPRTEVDISELTNELLTFAALNNLDLMIENGPPKRVRPTKSVFVPVEVQPPWHPTSHQLALRGVGLSQS